MKQILIFLLGTITIFGHGQNTSYYSTFSSESNDHLRDIIELSDGRIYIAGFQDALDSSVKTNGILLELNEWGLITDTLKVVIPGKNFLMEQIIPFKHDSVLLCGICKDSINAYTNTLQYIILNNDFQVISSIALESNPNNNFYDQHSSVGFNDDILVTGMVSQNDSVPWEMFAFRLNEDLDSLLFKVYDKPFTLGAEIRQVDTNKYFLFEEFRHFYILDSLFNIISQYPTPRRINSPYGIKWDTDTSFYLAGEWNDASDDDIGMYHSPHYEDTTVQYFNWWGTIDTLDLTARYALDFRNKDSIFICGTTNFTLNKLLAVPTWAFVLQTDSMLNIRWEKFLGGDANYRTEKIFATSDGGCLIGTTFYDYQNSPEPQLDMRIFKLDKYGQLVNIKGNSAIQITEAIVYPNPGTEYLKVRVAAQHSSSVFELYSMDGKLLIRKNISGKHATINTSTLTSGTYIYKVYNKNGLNESGKWVKP